jgi:hypothetical protein
LYAPFGAGLIVPPICVDAPVNGLMRKMLLRLLSAYSWPVFGRTSMLTRISPVMLNGRLTVYVTFRVLLSNVTSCCKFVRPYMASALAWETTAVTTTAANKK